MCLVVVRDRRRALGRFVRCPWGLHHPPDEGRREVQQLHELGQRQRLGNWQRTGRVENMHLSIVSRAVGSGRTRAEEHDDPRQERHRRFRFPSGARQVAYQIWDALAWPGCCTHQGPAGRTIFVRGRD